MPRAAIRRRSLGRHTVLVVIAAVGWRNLPSQATATCAIPTIWVSHIVVGRRGEVGPRRLALHVREANFGSMKSSDGPDTLFVVAYRGSLVDGQKVKIVATLVHDALGDEVIVGVIAGQTEVVEVCVHEKASLPPVVGADRRGTGQEPGNLSGLVAIVKGDEVLSECLGRLEDVLARVDLVRGIGGGSQCSEKERDRDGCRLDRSEWCDHDGRRRFKRVTRL